MAKNLEKKLLQNGENIFVTTVYEWREVHESKKKILLIKFRDVGKIINKMNHHATFSFATILQDPQTHICFICHVTFQG